MPVNHMIDSKQKNALGSTFFEKIFFLVTKSPV